MKFSYVILNYNTVNDTLKCVESIKKQMINKNDDFHITIVDNKSTDNSVCLLDSFFADDNNITIIKSNENLGFSRGNNLGYRYELENYSPDFLVMLNSDTIIKDYNFQDKIKEEYTKSKFGLMGPDVYNPNSKSHQSPIYLNTNFTYKFLLKNLVKNNLRYGVVLIDKISPKIFGKIREKKSQKRLNISKNYYENVCIHGSFMVFSKSYFSIFPEGLDERTFMYGEEDILCLLCKLNNLKIIYTPNIQIYHYEGQSAKKAFKHEISREYFKIKQMIRANKIIKDILVNNKGNKYD